MSDAMCCSGPAKDDGGGSRDGENAVNSGSNLFVTGIHPRLSEDEVTRLFSKYGNVEKCQIMRDPHTKESRGFGFVNFMTSDEADAARDGLQGKELEGRTLSIEKARRSRPRTPTPGKYFGPPKRGMSSTLSTHTIALSCSRHNRGRSASRPFRRRPIRRRQARVRRWWPRRSLR
jgi:RNA recognition motif-containing protein